jgi:hypothetical protein
VGQYPPGAHAPLDDAAPCGHSVHGCGFDSTTDADLTSLLLPADSIKLIDASGTGPSGVGRRLYCRSNTNGMSAPPPVLNHQLVAQAGAGRHLHGVGLRARWTFWSGAGAGGHDAHIKRALDPKNILNR